jgi:hypothetical protein
MFIGRALNSLLRAVPSSLSAAAALRLPRPHSSPRTIVTMAVGDKRKPVKIATHSGSFHCDEALGCYLLRLTPEFAEGEIVRSRDPEVLKECDVVIDVGGVYDPATHR